jgi:hypothetical protein
MLHAIKKGYGLALSPKMSLAIRLAVALIGGYILSAGLSLLTSTIIGGTEREMRTIVHFMFFLYYAFSIMTFVSINSLYRSVWIALGTNVVVWGSWWLLGGQTV